jgi:hypothetical protein
MNNEYSTSEVIELGMAEDLIRGKQGQGPDEMVFIFTMDDFDEE